MEVEMLGGLQVPLAGKPLGLGKCLGLTERPGRGSTD